jgi:hypothetical protein
MEKSRTKSRGLFICNGLDAASGLAPATGWDWPLRFPKFSHTASEGGKAMAASAVGQRGGAWAMWRNRPRPQRSRVGGYAGYFGLLTLLFIQPLTRLALYAAHSDLHSHILLVPFIAGYLLYIQRGRPFAADRSSIAGTVTVGGIGFVASAAGIYWRGDLSINDQATLKGRVALTGDSLPFCQIS